ncbi:MULTISPECIES: PRD domain-containing protein [Streptomyces]|uniref:Transcriptional antiterminator n=1 Tax=Streptomyces qinglanensis TaxID=943816 RepID=A0A1E7K7H9_9ACTN|nr:MULTISPECIES: PRD domain-containing protein [Streptomyces]MBE9500421.1 PRD domain-containing protein [Streptomyces sp. GKU 257-1]OEU99892.1 transcriptional antiterminator [Streptomyces qinglanensis]OEV26361.1 transcriptional antiterminator [Streptomyces nanshensis]
MDDQLALRIQLFRDGGRVRPEVADFVTAELSALADEGAPVTEETAGMLTSHLMMALTRLLDGESIEEFRTDDQVAAELADHPAAVSRARRVATRAETELGAALPGSEINFLAMHLAVLAQRVSP